MKRNPAGIILAIILVSVSPYSFAQLIGSSMVDGSPALDAAFRSGDGAANLSDVQSYLNKLLPYDLSTACSAMLATIGQSRTRVLIASYDTSGRHFCYNVSIFQRLGKKYLKTDLTADEVEDVSKIIGAVDSSGVQYVLLPEDISDYKGAGCMGVIPFIFDIQLGHVHDVSKRFPKFYSRQLANFSVPQQPQALNDIRRLSICDKVRVMEQDKLKRMSGIDLQAGFTTALEWMRSPDYQTRLQAIWTFEDIGSEASITQLYILARDSNPAVSGSAKGALERLGR